MESDNDPRNSIAVLLSSCEILFQPLDLLLNKVREICFELRIEENIVNQSKIERIVFGFTAQPTRAGHTESVTRSHEVPRNLVITNSYMIGDNAGNRLESATLFIPNQLIGIGVR